MSFFGEAEETTPLQEFLASSGDASTRMESSDTWKTAAKVAAAGVIIAGTCYAVSRMRSTSRNREKSDKNGKLPPPLIGVPKTGKRAGAVVKDVAKPEGNRVKNQVTKVSHLTVYPVKSCRGVEVESFYCGELGPEIHTPHGIVHDRSWMVATKNGFLTQRQKPRMSLVQPSFEGEFMVLSAPDFLPLRVPLSPNSSTMNAVTTEVFGQAIDAVDCGAEAGEWFSDYLQLPGLRLLYHPKSFGGRNRAENEKKASDKEVWDQKDACAFADDGPYSILSEESVNEFSRHTPEPVPWIHFRPNIVVSGCPANSEDYWWRFRMGEAEFRNTKLTPRCVETTVDPQTGTFARKDILETLKTVRVNQSPEWDDLYGGGPLMAILGAVDKLGEVSVGDYVVHLEE